jgi:1-acyl-sn-glycerol-3-phosphate acyltransferase
LNALERRVEEALAAGGAGRVPVGGEVVRAALDESLAAWAMLRRRTVRELITGLGLGRSGPPLPRELVLQGLYRLWWRVETVGIGRVPASGPIILAVNRAGSLLPYEALMVAVAVEMHRPARPLVDDWMIQRPVIGPVLGGLGAMQASSANLRRLLRQAQAVVLYPEGPAALAKGFGERYRLARFGRGAFARVAIETGASIVPVAVIGAEEVHPVLARLDTAGRFLGLPTLPITPTFPLFGLAGLVPLPTKWTLHFGEPLEVAARHTPADAARPEHVAVLRDQVRERLQSLVVEGLRQRRSVFFG